MGVQQFLGKVLPTAGREIDLRNYAEIHGSRRSFRVAVDIASIVYKATQGFGDMLADERHLDNYGRAELRRQERDAAAAAAAAATSDNNNKPKPEYDRKVQQYVQKCTQYVLDFLEQFRQAGIDMLVVLDGSTPPIKARQVRIRSNKRKEAEAVRDAAVDDGNVNLQARLMGFRRAGAGKHFSLVIDGVISAMRSNRIPFLVAPYESDGQLAFLSEKRYVDLIVTEDSDLLACGASPVLYKACMKKKNAEEQDGICGILLRTEDLSCSRELALMDYSSAMLATVFVAAGSDYCEKLKGIGIVTACDAARKAFHANPEKVDNRAPLELFFGQIYKASFSKNLTDDLKRDYEARFLGALLMFRHPVVFNPITGRCESFRLDSPDPELILYEPYAALVRDETARSKFVGELIPSPLACYLAEGWLDPRTMQPRQFTRLPDHVDACYKEWRNQQLNKKKPAEPPSDSSQEKPKSPPARSFQEASLRIDDSKAGKSEECAICIDDDDDSTGVEVVDLSTQPDTVPSIAALQRALSKDVSQRNTTKTANASQDEMQFETQQMI